MTNYERWKDEVIKIIAAANPVAVVNGVPTACKPNIACSTCDLRPNNVCSDKLTEWFEEEYVEPVKPERPKLTEREWHLCKVLGKGWIAKDNDDGNDYMGTVFHYEHKPSRDDLGNWNSDRGDAISLSNMFDVTFEGVHDINTKAWAVEELLKLEVSDE